MKRIIILTLALCALCLGCKTVNPTGKAIATAAVTVDAAMKGWAVWVHEGKATLEQEAKVESAWVKYKLVEASARQAYAAAYAVKDQGGMAQAIAALQSAVADLNCLIATFKTGGTL